MLRSAVQRIRSLQHPFPALVGLVFIVVTMLGINGSSVGMYHNILYGSSEEDSSLVYGNPRAIRSDEWVNWTVLTVSQKENGFKKYNENLSTGQNLALQPDVPVLDWSTVFRPHNWAFFGLPFDIAFAFRWWFLLALLLIASYFYAYRHLQNKILATLFSIAVAASPFIFWWYQSTVVGVLAYGFIALLLFDRIISASSFKKRVKPMTLALEVIGIGYLLMAFALLFYPPFQIPIGIVLGFYFVGRLIDATSNRGIKLRDVAVRLSPILAGVAIVIGLGLLFVYQNYEVIHSLSTSAYPGKRVIESGGMKDVQLFNGFVQAILQSDYRSSHFIMNQSEISNFILIAPYLLPLSLLVIYAGHKENRRLDWVHLMVTLVIALFLVRLFTHFGQPLFKLLLLDKVPPQRLLIGLGFAGFLQILYILKSSAVLKVLNANMLLLLRVLYAAVCAAVVGYFALKMRHNYPEFLTSDVLAIGLAGAFWVILVAFIFQQKYTALGLLALFTLASSFKVMPLYHGLGELESGRVVRTIENKYRDDGLWATVDFPTFEGIASVAGEPTLTGVNTYPDTAYWQPILGQQNSTVYNRQAHVTINSDPTNASLVKLVTNSSYTIKLSCDLLDQTNVDYILAPGTLDRSCLEQLQTIQYPNVVFYVYRVNHSHF